MDTEISGTLVKEKIKDRTENNSYSWSESKSDCWVKTISESDSATSWIECKGEKGRSEQDRVNELRAIPQNETSNRISGRHKRNNSEERQILSNTLTWE